MEQGTCHLCGQKGILRNGHVWPAWVYRNYAAEMDRGGRFLRLGDGKLDNHPERHYWFCPHCENETLGGWDGYASRLCRGIDQSPDDPVPYDERLLKFAVSISWRTAKAHIERNGGKTLPKLRAACRQWKSYLLGKRHRVEPYSQHIYIVHDPAMERHNALGGNVFPKEDFVFTQIGPLWIFGLLTRENLGLRDIKVWDQSKLVPEGGVIDRIKEWRIGRIITMKCIKFLCRFEKNLISRCREIVPKLGNRLS